MEHEHPWSLEAVVAETRAALIHLREEVADLRGELRHDVRRLDDRIFQLLLIQLATLAGTLGSLIVALVSLTSH